MKHIKKINYLILILIAFMIGITVAAIIHNHDVYTHWWGHILVILGTILVAVSIHELTHAFVFSIKKIKIKAVYIFIFMFIRKKKYFKVKVNPKLILLGGGLVVPLLPPITNDEEMEEVGKAISKSLIAAPIASIVLGLLWFVSFLLILSFSGNFVLIALSISSTFTILILTVLINLASSVSSEMAAGDYVAYKRVLEDKDFLLQVISSYISFNPEADELSREYLNAKKDDYLLQKTISNSLIGQYFAMDYLYDVIFKERERNIEIDKKIAKLSRHSLKKSNEGVTLIYLTAYNFYVTGEIEKAFELVNWLENIAGAKLANKHLEYEKRRAKYLLNISDELPFLLDKKNQYVGYDWILEPLIDDKTDYSLLQPLKPGIKKPQVKFFNKI